jgi:hypothetical protein
MTTLPVVWRKHRGCYSLLLQVILALTAAPSYCRQSCCHTGHASSSVNSMHHQRSVIESPAPRVPARAQMQLLQQQQPLLVHRQHATGQSAMRGVMSYIHHILYTSKSASSCWNMAT